MQGAPLAVASGKPRSKHRQLWSASRCNKKLAPRPGAPIPGQQIVGCRRSVFTGGVLVNLAAVLLQMFVAPRLVKLAANEPVELLTIVSQRQTGARLVLIRLSGDRLAPGAESPAVGTSMRWLNPVGVVDLDGDGRVDRPRDGRLQ